MTKKTKFTPKQKQAMSILSEWGRVAFDHETAFLEKFTDSGWTLTEVSWDEARMRIVYILDSGQHVSNSIDIVEWFEFYNRKKSLPAE